VAPKQPTQRRHHTSAEAGYHRPPHIDSDASQISDIFDQTRLTSSATSHTTQEDSGKCLGKSPEQEKAKQVMGLNPAKPLSSGSQHRKTHGEDGNIVALEKAYADTLTLQKPMFEVERNSVEEKGSEDIDRIKETARDIYNGTELLIALGDAARWLMNSNDFNTKVRTAYMELYDFMGLDILTSVRWFPF